VIRQCGAVITERKKDLADRLVMRLTLTFRDYYREYLRSFFKAAVTRVAISVSSPRS